MDKVCSPNYENNRDLIDAVFDLEGKNRILKQQNKELLENINELKEEMCSSCESGSCSGSCIVHKKEKRND